jgi:tetratricopeptide (TPR) repeat protein
MSKKAIFGILLLTTTSGLVSQNLSNTSSDSLNRWVESQLVTTPDTTKVYKIAHLSLFLSNKEKNETALINAFQNLAKYHELYGQLDSAIYYFNLLKNIYKNGRMEEAVAETCMELKGLYGSKAAYSESLKQVFEALEIYEEKKDQSGIALCYTHICDLLYYENKYLESVDYCEKAIAIQKEIDAKSDLAVSYRYKAASVMTC